MKFAFAATLLATATLAQDAVVMPDDAEVCPLVTHPDGTVTFDCPEDRNAGLL